MKPAKKKLNKGWIILGGAIVLIISVFGAYRIWFAQPSQESIDAAMASQDWSRATRLLERADLTKDGGENHYNMALAYSNLGKSTEAIEAYMRADNKDYKRSLSRYEIACLYAESGEYDLALAWLQDALDSGFSSDELILNESSFDSIRDTDQFMRILDPISFEEDAKLGGLDFLIGTWNTRQGGGLNANVVFTETIEGQVIVESWEGNTQGRANGVFVRDPETDEWTYSYVDNWGRIFRGNVQVRKQIATITGTMTYAHGAEIVRRVDIRSAVDVIDYATADSPDGGVSFYPTQRSRLNPSTSQSKPSF